MNAPGVPNDSVDDLERWLCAWVRDTLGPAAGEMDPEITFAAHGLGSVDLVSLAGELEDRLGRPLPESVAYDAPSPRLLARALLAGRPAPDPAEPLRDVAAPAGPVGIVGMSCRFPGGGDHPRGFWEALLAGRDAVTDMPAGRWHIGDRGVPGRRIGAFLHDIAGWDAGFFGLSPREALRTDPRQRLLMELVWEALENSGIAPTSLSGTRTAVFLGMMESDQYTRLQLDREGRSCVEDPHFAVGSAGSIAAGRIAHWLDLRGPAVTVDTACSSSLVAVHLATESLARGECDLAIAAGVALTVHPDAHVEASAMSMLSPDARCKTFSAGADGFAMGEGGGVVVLERRSGTDRRGGRTRAVVRGSATNQDGRSNGLTAPSRAAQEAVIRQAVEMADVAPDDISYVEAHGSGTRIGDTIEIEALHDVFGDRAADRPLYVGAVKTNIGHLLAAAGMAGLIKTVLVLEHRAAPPNLHFTEPIPAVRDRPRIRPVTEVLPLGGEHPLLAGVSSFGWSGTNAHLVLAAADAGEQPGEDPRTHVLPLSAATPEAVVATARMLAGHLTHQAGVNLADVAYTLQTGRARLAYRRAVVCHDRESAIRALTAVEAADVVRCPAQPAGAEPDGSDLEPVPGPGASDTRAVHLEDAARRWERGAEIPWAATHPARRVLLQLPTYPFQRESRYWPADTAEQAPAGTGGASTRGTAWVPAWRRSRVPAGAPDAATLRGTVLVFCDTIGIGAATAGLIRRGGRTAVEVYTGEAYTRSGDRVTIDPDQPAHYRQLIEDLAPEPAAGPLHVAHLWSMLTPPALTAAGSGAGDEALQRSVSHAFVSLLLLVQALGDRPERQPVRLLTVTAGAIDLRGSDSPAPERALAHGLGRTVPAEYPGIRWAGTDLEAGDRPVAEAASHLVTELIGLDERAPSAVAEPGRLSAWRLGRRWARGWTAVDVSPAAAGSPWRTDATYLITGGTRGLGLAVARRLAESGVRKLALVARTELPAREQWDRLLRTGGADVRTLGTLRAVRELEAAGAEVLPVTADVADPDQLRAALRHTRAHLGGLHAVVHAAGVPGGGLLRNKTAEQATSVIASKLMALRPLAELTGSAVPDGERLELVVLFSSAVSVFGGLGEGDYCAANTVLDAFAGRCSDEAGTTVVSLAWGPWQHDDWQSAAPAEVTALTARYRQQYGFQEREALALLERMVTDRHAEAVLLKQPLADAAVAWSAFSDLDALVHRSAAGVRGHRYPRPQLRAPFVEPRNDLERRIAAVWQDHLGIDRIGVHDAFFDLGGNSLIGVALARDLEKELALALPAAVMFQHPTVAALAAGLGAGSGGGERTSALTDSATRGERRRKARGGRRG